MGICPLVIMCEASKLMTQFWYRYANLQIISTNLSRQLNLWTSAVERLFFNLAARGDDSVVPCSFVLPYPDTLLEVNIDNCHIAGEVHIIFIFVLLNHFLEAYILQE